jgi:hypothetical protein
MLEVPFLDGAPGHFTQDAPIGGKLEGSGGHGGDSPGDFVPLILIPLGTPAKIHRKTLTHTQQRLPVGTLVVIVLLCPWSNIQSKLLRHHCDSSS